MNVTKETTEAALQSLNHHLTPCLSFITVIEGYLKLLDFQTFWNRDPLVADPEDKREVKLYFLKQIANASNGLKSQSILAIASVLPETEHNQSYFKTELSTYIQSLREENSRQDVQWDYIETELRTLLSRYLNWIELSQTIHSLAFIHPLESTEKALGSDTPEQRLSAIKQALNNLYTT